MIARGQLFVRAQDPNGKWHSADVFDLDEDSFRAWITYQMMICRHAGGLRHTYGPYDEITLKSRTIAPDDAKHERD